jgi:hypothetical protein
MSEITTCFIHPNPRKDSEDYFRGYLDGVAEERARNGTTERGRRELEDERRKKEQAIHIRFH